MFRPSPTSRIVASLGPIVWWTVCLPLACLLYFVEWIEEISREYDYDDDRTFTWYWVPVSVAIWPRAVALRWLLA